MESRLNFTLIFISFFTHNIGVCGSGGKANCPLIGRQVVDPVLLQSDMSVQKQNVETQTVSAWFIGTLQNEI